MKLQGVGTKYSASDRHACVMHSSHAASYSLRISSPSANLRSPSRYDMASLYVDGTTVLPIGSASSLAIVKQNVFVSLRT